MATSDKSKQGLRADGYTDIMSYGFDQEEAVDIAIGLELYKQWAEEQAENQDPRYTKLFRDFSGGSDAGVLLVAGFFGGIEKWLEVESLMRGGTDA